MSLHTAYRPSELDQFIGNDSEIEKLISVLDRKEKDRQHTFLFQGPRGCGKTTLARIAAKEMGCNEKDILEIDVTTNRGIDAAKVLKEDLIYKPLHGKTKAIILDEVHMGTTAFFNALLKPLEEPPDHVYWLLCTTDPQKLLATVRSRCMIFKVDPLRESETFELLEEIKEAEQADIDSKFLKIIAKKSEGIPREALIMLDSIIDLEANRIETAITAYKSQEKQIIDLCRALLSKKGWNVISGVLNNIKEEPETTRWAVLGYMSSVMLKGNSLEVASRIIEEFSDPFFNNGKAGLIKACYMAGV